MGKWILEIVAILCCATALVSNACMAVKEVDINKELRAQALEIDKLYNDNLMLHHYIDMIGEQLGELQAEAYFMRKEMKLEDF